MNVFTYEGSNINLRKHTSLVLNKKYIVLYHTALTPSKIYVTKQTLKEKVFFTDNKGCDEFIPLWQILRPHICQIIFHISYHRH